MQEGVCKPLEMVDSGFSIPVEKRSRFASCHTVKDGKAIVVDKGSTSQFSEGFGFLSGGGGMVSTMSDYANFCQMLVDGGSFKGRQILKPSTLQEMFTNQMKEAAGPMQFGLGFAINEVKLGTGSEQVVDQQFSWAGYATTDFRVFPGQKLFQIYWKQMQPGWSYVKSINTPTGRMTVLNKQDGELLILDNGAPRWPTCTWATRCA